MIDLNNENDIHTFVLKKAVMEIAKRKIATNYLFLDATNFVANIYMKEANLYFEAINEEDFEADIDSYKLKFHALKKEDLDKDIDLQSKFVLSSSLGLYAASEAGELEKIFKSYIDIVSPLTILNVFYNDLKECYNDIQKEERFTDKIRPKVILAQKDIEVLIKGLGGNSLEDAYKAAIEFSSSDFANHILKCEPIFELAESDKTPEERDNDFFNNFKNNLKEVVEVVGNMISSTQDDASVC